MTSIPVACLIAVVPVFTAAANLPEWPQFGGPNRNFTADSAAIADAWPAAGPKKLWARPLGEGYSGIAVDSGTLFTMYRKNNDEFVVALDAATGKALWEYSYAAAFIPGLAMENGAGPHSTPLVLADRVCTIGILARLQCFEKKTGKVLWSKDLYKDFPGSTQMDRGYSGSPMMYKNNMILTLGGHGHAVIALNPSNGSLVWANGDFGNAPSSPTLINVQGQDQLVSFFNDEGTTSARGMIAGLDPNNGNLLWSHPHKTSWNLNIALPVWGDDNILFISSAYGTGSAALRLTRDGNRTKVEELWANNRFRIHHGTIVRLGDYAYGSSGDFGPAPLMAINVKTGQMKWQERAFAKANFVYADGKFIVLDEEGMLWLAKFSPEGVNVLSKASLLTNNCWTAPSLAGSKLYIRDRKSIMALEVGPDGAK